MSARTARTAAFRALHGAGCFVMANAWDTGSARLFAGAGMKALATTSSGFAAREGHRDGAGELAREAAIAHAAEIAAATGLPVSADLEDCYAATPEGVAETVRLAAAAGLAGLSIEDIRPGAADPAWPFDEAVARVAAAAAAAREADIVLTARADGMLHGAYGLDGALARLRAFEAAGAEVLYAPGLPDLAALRSLCAGVSRPVNHVIGLGAAGAGLAEIAAAGVRRVSLGGSLARVAYGAALEAACEIAEGRFDRAEAGPGWGEIRAAMAAGRDTAGALENPAADASAAEPPPV
ncbi:oxaloacetate decarboxylase [Paralimibaculum aggregatum]|uniref:Oxaloacetate decarboxylase n=1 Tax=Paralimibaculum aggregatum TaxID=3036245 RepID=A0ABQ6LNX3_9RHOB|nr:isocitrate lyase/phosphoenolpyruvate mutase family protein [Limibaculum sp. NKW23]GMG82319.1 oxaloacetate decarboxylase [Limibaculum sp. NKW23]